MTSLPNEVRLRLANFVALHRERAEVFAVYGRSRGSSIERGLAESIASIRELRDNAPSYESWQACLEILRHGMRANRARTQSIEQSLDYLFCDTPSPLSHNAR
jgi:hypothetical protein